MIAPRLGELSEHRKIFLRHEHALLRKFGHFLFQFVQRSRSLDVIFLFAEVIAESFDVDPKLVRDHFTRPCVVIFGVMSLPRIGSPVGQCFNDPKFIRDKSPILVEALKFTDEIGEHNSVMIDKPIELVPIRGRMDTRGAAVHESNRQTARTSFCL